MMVCIFPVLFVVILLPVFVRFYSHEHDPEKWIPVFGEDHAPAISMTPKSGYRFSNRLVPAPAGIMLQQDAGAR